MVFDLSMSCINYLGLFSFSFFLRKELCRLSLIESNLLSIMVYNSSFCQLQVLYFISYIMAVNFTGTDIRSRGRIRGVLVARTTKVTQRQEALPWENVVHRTSCSSKVWECWKAPKPGFCKKKKLWGETSKGLQKMTLFV